MINLLFAVGEVVDCVGCASACDEVTVTGVRLFRKGETVKKLSTGDCGVMGEDYWCYKLSHSDGYYAQKFLRRRHRKSSWSDFEAITGFNPTRVVETVDG